MSTTNELGTQFFDLALAKLPLPHQHPHYNARALEPESQLLPKGHVKKECLRAFPVDVILERDAAIPMRDGALIYTDIFRPADSNENKVPALMPWSPYGKNGTEPEMYDVMGPFRAGVPVGHPAEWCGRGYAIINVDARGAGFSEGNISFWGQQEAEDIYDTIDDPYRDLLTRGGVPHNTAFNKVMLASLAGPNYAEDLVTMLEKRPLCDDFWKSKMIRTEQIGDVPLYLVASYSSGLHSNGSFRTFRTAQSKRKWLRVHPYHEWYDLYRPEINDKLQRYFDTYCKGIETGWEETPPVRLSLLAFERSSAKTVIERPEREYPLARQQLKTYYLDASKGGLSEQLASSTSIATHKGHDLNSQSDFVLHFDEATELAGYPSVQLWVSCPEHDDLDVAVQIRKISATSELLEHLNYPCPVPVTRVPSLNVAKTLGPQGFLRASHAVTKDVDLSRGNEFYYKHDRRVPIQPGAIVSLDITLWPIGMVFAKGEGVMLRISGHDMCLPEFEGVRLREAVDSNVGIHNVYTGKDYPSSLTLPVIPNSSISLPLDK
ncbi:alpha/beta-hydrolase [Stipitochalara longipes BDJ]|nr:alpha/beta-hydrolase [Stipitochalara longipes BDJ]